MPKSNHGNAQPDLKFCPRCKCWKHLSDFNRNANSRDGYQHYCRICMKEYREEQLEKTGETWWGYRRRLIEERKSLPRGWPTIASEAKWTKDEMRKWFDETIIEQRGRCLVCLVKMTAKNGQDSVRIKVDLETNCPEALICRHCLESLKDGNEPNDLWWLKQPERILSPIKYEYGLDRGLSRRERLLEYAFDEWRLAKTDSMRSWISLLEMAILSGEHAAIKPIVARMSVRRRRGPKSKTRNKKGQFEVRE